MPWKPSRAQHANHHGNPGICVYKGEYKRGNKCNLSRQTIVNKQRMYLPVSSHCSVQEMNNVRAGGQQGETTTRQFPDSRHSSQARRHFNFNLLRQFYKIIKQRNRQITNSFSCRLLFSCEMTLFKIAEQLQANINSTAEANILWLGTTDLCWSLILL